MSKNSKQILNTHNIVNAIELKEKFGYASKDLILSNEDNAAILIEKTKYIVLLFFIYTLCKKAAFL